MGSILNKLLSSFNAKPSKSEAKSFKESQALEEAFDSIKRGTIQVPLSHIVGSVGRYKDFDAQFHPKAHVKSQRYNAVWECMHQGKKLPPVKLYQIKDEYYVLDGNHRVAAAKDMGEKYIRADIIEFIPSKKTIENVLFQERGDFVKATGLPYNINMTELGQYARMLEQIAYHRAFLSQKRNRDVDLAEAATDWYQYIYHPLTTIIASNNLGHDFPERTEADLYMYITANRWHEDRKRKYGVGLDKLIPNDMEVFRAKMKSKGEKNYTDMLRQIPVFVLIKTQVGSNEKGLMRKLFALDEVLELHSIHGHMDMLAKVRLERDFASLDAELIDEFVSEKIHSFESVVSTETLIPGRSMIKS